VGHESLHFAFCILHSVFCIGIQRRPILHGAGTRMKNPRDSISRGDHYSWPNAKIPPGGVEPSTENTGKTGVDKQCGAENGAQDAREAQKDPRLAVVLDAWAKLPESTRDDILAMIEATGRLSLGRPANVRCDR
jgi:hypothetical protein